MVHIEPTTSLFEPGAQSGECAASTSYFRGLVNSLRFANNDCQYSGDEDLNTFKRETASMVPGIKGDRVFIA